MEALVLTASLLLAVIFAAAGATKVLDLSGSKEAMEGFGLPASLARPLGVVVPVAELAVAAVLLAPPTAAWGGLGALFLLTAFSVAIAWNLARGRAPDCHCFGQLHSSPAGPRTLARNAVLIALAGVVASQADLAWSTLAASAGLAIVGASATVSRRASPAGSDHGAQGLAVGSRAPSFELPALEGYSASLESLLEAGKPTLLVFSDPHCGPCQELAPEVAKWQRLHSDELTIAVIERRDGANMGRDEHHRRSVLLQNDTEVSDAYGARGTPAAVLVGADGRVASVVAGGSIEIEALMAEHVTRFEPHPIEVEGGSAWTVPFRLGGPVMRRELLVRGAGASAAASAVLTWPARALGKRRAGPPRCDRDKDCPKDTICRSGRCACRGRFANRCRGECVNYDEGADPDGKNCGGCGRPPCPDGSVCAGGRCVTGDGSDCEDFPGTICCQGEVIFPSSERQHCGGCGISCRSGQQCCSGRCIDPRTEPRYCGGCLDGRRCAPNQVCHNGKCRDECPKPLRQCGQTCGNPNSQICCGKKVVIDKEDIANGFLKCCGGKALEPTPSGDCPSQCSSDSGCFGDERCCDGVCTYAGAAPNCGGCNRGPCDGSKGCQCGCVNGKLGCYNTVGSGGGPCPDGDAGFIGSPGNPGPGGCP